MEKIRALEADHCRDTTFVNQVAMPFAKARIFSCVLPNDEQKI
jgi:hypothetical protein